MLNFSRLSTKAFQLLGICLLATFPAITSAGTLTFKYHGTKNFYSLSRSVAMNTPDRYPEYERAREYEFVFSVPSLPTPNFEFRHVPENLLLSSVIAEQSNPYNATLTGTPDTMGLAPGAYSLTVTLTDGEIDFSAEFGSLDHIESISVTGDKAFYGRDINQGDAIVLGSGYMTARYDPAPGSDEQSFVYFSAVPLPAAGLLLVSSCLGLALFKRRRKVSA